MWFAFGLLSGLLRATIVLIQEKVNMQPVIFGMWTKICCVVFLLPVVIHTGIPNDPLFYLFTLCSAIIWSIADIIMWRTIPIVGAGVFSRTIPLSVFLNFLLWFAIDPGLINKYAGQATISLSILVVFALSTYFATRLKKCPVTNQAIRKVWFVILSFAIGPLAAMLASKHATIQQGPWNFVFFEALFMLFMWIVYIFARAPIKAKELVTPDNIKFGIISGIIMVTMVASYIYGLYHADNPGYILALISLEAVFVSIARYLLGRKDDSDIKAGLGMVACAIALILLKSAMQ